MRYTKTEVEESLANLREWIKPGSVVYTILRHVSRSGMSRNVSVVVPFRGDFLHPNHAVAVVTGQPLVRGWNDSVKVGGCGMDMGFALVYGLSRRLFPEGYGCIGEGCPSNDHSNGDRDYTPHGSVGGCRAGKQPCVCHDESSWAVGGWPNGCSSCGCHRVTHWHKDGGYALKQRWL